MSLHRIVCLATSILIALANIAGAVPPEPHYKLVLQTPPATAVDSVTVSPDGSLVAAAAGEGGVRLYDASTGRLIRVIGETGDRSVVFSPDGKLLTAAGFHMDKLVSLWDVATGKRLQTFTGQTEWEADATAISPDGKLLASTATDKQILVWEIATGELRLQLKDQPFRIAALAFSPDSALLASGGGDKMVHLWDASTGKLKRSLAGHRDWICTLAFSPDGKSIASGSCDWGFHRGHDWPRPVLRGAEQSEWRLWDVATGNLKRSVTETGRILSLAMAPSGKSLACGVSKEVRLYDLNSEAAGQVITTHDADVTSVAFTPDGAAIISGSHDHTVKHTTVATSKVDWRAPGYFEQVNSVALSRDASLLVTGSSDGRFASGKLPAGAPPIGPGAVRLWDAHSGRLLRRLGDPAEQVMAVAVSPDDKRVAAGGAGTKGAGTTFVWDAATGEPAWSVADHAKEVLAVAFAPDGQSLASGAADGVVRIRDAASGKVMRVLEGHQGGATSLVFSPDGKVLFCAEAHGGTRVWETVSGRLLRAHPAATTLSSLFVSDRLLNSVCLSQDGGTLATCASSVNNELVDPVRTWDARTGMLTRGYAAENIHGRPMALSPDGSLIATGGKSIKLWDVRTGKLVRELYGHLKRTQSIVLSADGRLIVSGGSYGTTNAWEVATGKHLVTLFAFTNSRGSQVSDDWLAYHPDGFYDGSSGIESYLAWRVGDELQLASALSGELHRPDKIAAALNLDAPPAAGQPSQN